MEKISVFGNLGNENALFGGQETKTRNYIKALRNRYGYDAVSTLSTYQWKKHPLLFLRGLISLCQSSRDVLMLPGASAIKVLFPICYFMKKRYHFTFLYPVVGGWIAEFLSNHKFIAKRFGSIDKVYVETNEMVAKLSKMGYNNVELAPVFTYRIGVREANFECFDSEPYQLCTFSRVTKDKGISIAIDAVNKLNISAGRLKYKLNIFGKVNPEYEDELSSLLKACEYNATEYCGILPDNEVIDALSKHCLMLFPTFYSGEGFPATTLESMMASTPIIASDWKYNSEIIIPDVNGYLFDLNEGSDGLADVIDRKFNNIEKLKELRTTCLVHSRKYTPESVLAPMFELLDSERQMNRK